MDQRQIIAKLSELMPFPKDHEIGLDIYEDHFGDLEVGDGQNVEMWCDGEYCFHSHPIGRFAQTLSATDIHILMEGDLKGSFLGYCDKLFYFAVTDKLRQLYEENKDHDKLIEFYFKKAKKRLI
jgi:hypothetical protein